MKHYSVETVRLAASGQWNYILRSICGLSEEETTPTKRGRPCPHCGGHDRYEYKSNEDGFYMCRHCGAGDGFSMVMKRCDCSFVQAIQSVATHLQLQLPDVGLDRGALKCRKKRKAEESPWQFDEDKKQQKAAKRANQLFRQSFSADLDHPYLLKKQVGSYGLRQLGQQLLVPVSDQHGHLTSIQFIEGNGAKRFLAGGRVRGCFCQIGNLGNRIYITEGYATGATIHKAMGDAVVIAFFASNLSPVAISIRKQYPDLSIVIAADNDRFTPGNPGVTQGRQAANSVRGSLVYPIFPIDQAGTDYNDLALLGESSL